jgi:hypothetical protein
MTFHGTTNSGAEEYRATQLVKLYHEGTEGTDRGAVRSRAGLVQLHGVHNHDLGVPHSQVRPAAA